MINIKKSKRKYKIKLEVTRAKLSIQEYINIQNEIFSILDNLKKEAIKNDIHKFISEK